MKVFRFGGGIQMTDPSPQVLDRVITKWERSPGVRFDDVLSVYRFPFFSTDRQRDCVRSTWISEHQTINDRTFLVVPDRHIANQVRASLVYRVPVYYGKPETEMFDSSAVERVLGYSVARGALRGVWPGDVGESRFSCHSHMGSQPRISNY